MNLIYLSNSISNLSEDQSFKEIKTILSDLSDRLKLVKSNNLNSNNNNNTLIIQDEINSTTIDKEFLETLVLSNELKVKLEDNLFYLRKQHKEKENDENHNFYFTETILYVNKNNNNDSNNNNIIKISNIPTDEIITEIYINTLYNGKLNEFNYFINHSNEDNTGELYFIKSNKYKSLLEMANFLRTNKYSGLFEIHITVGNGNLENQEKFIEFCKVRKLKTILIELPDNSNINNKSSTFQMMTSSHHHGDLLLVQLIAFKLSNELYNSNFKIERIKIETLVSGKGVPNSKEELQSQSPFNYFEFHLKLLLPMNSDLKILKDLIKPYQGHLSRNSFKKFHNHQTEIRFVTLRIYDTYKELALKHYESLYSCLSVNSYQIDSAHKEYSLYDTNVSLDKTWILTSTQHH